MIQESKILLELDIALNAVKMGNVILCPTDSIWGLGCDPENASAVERVYEIKKRARNKPLILLVSDIEMLKRFVAIHPRIETLLVVHKQPLTLIYKKVRNIPDYLLAPDGSVGIRICYHEFCNELIKKMNKPLVSTSANFSGEDFPKTYDDINPKLIKMVDHVVSNSSSEAEGKPSVVASFNHKGELKFLRL